MYCILLFYQALIPFCSLQLQCSYINVLSYSVYYYYGSFTILLDIHLLFSINFELLIVLFLTQLRETVNHNKASYVSLNDLKNFCSNFSIVFKIYGELQTRQTP